MPVNSNPSKYLGWGILIIILILSACRPVVLPISPTLSPVGKPVTITTSSTVSPTASVPLPTVSPPAALINDEAVSLVEYQAELTRFHQATSRDLTPDDQKQVVNDLINLVLLAQGAKENGFTLDDQDLQKRLDILASQAGGQAALQDWQASNGYSNDMFNQAFGRSVAAAWMRDRISTEVPTATEQVHARQILLYNSDDANLVHSQLQAGKDFATLAGIYDPFTAGELGWFPRGYLITPEIEAAAFSLAPKAYSSVVKTPNGFVILQVIERDPARPLDTAARQVLQARALQAWLAQRRNQSKIQLFIP